MPIGISAFLTIAGVVLRRRWLAVVGVVTLLTFSMQPVSRLMMRPLEGVYRPTTVASAPDADAIVILSGGILRGVAAPGVQWGESANRFFSGVDLARAGKAKLVIISSGSLRMEGAILRQTAIRDGIPPERIIVTPLVYTTEDESRAVSQISGVHSILLVTSAAHMPRAVLLFRAHGLDVTPFPTDERVLGAQIPTSTEFIPGSGPLRESESAMREYFGMAIYRTILFFQPMSRKTQ